MHGTDDSRGPSRCIGDAAKSAFLDALRAGARREDAAAGAGFSLTGFYGARRRDPDFAAAWEEALARPAAAERRRGAYVERGACPEPGRGETRITPNNRRGLQRRRMRHVRFDDRRRAVFLHHFGWSCDARDAAARAGVSESTVYLHRRTDPGFAEEFGAALDQGYVRLEAEAVRQRLAAQQALRDALEEADEIPPEAAVEFDRVLKLLDRRDRRARRPERSASPGSPRRVWTFDAAIALLDKRLKALGLAVPPLPPDVAARYDGLPGGGEDDAQ